MKNSVCLQIRPTPAHLTSVQAEQILAQACENESHNAKRMRLGLEPVSQPMPTSAPGIVSPYNAIPSLLFEFLIQVYKYIYTFFFLFCYRR